MKEIPLHGLTQLMPLCENWYFASDYDCGELYEAADCVRSGHDFRGVYLALVRADGTVFEPIPRQRNRYIQPPVVWNGRFYLLTADFSGQTLEIRSFDPGTAETVLDFSFPLSDFSDLHNLRLGAAPLMLTRSAKRTFEVLWPEKRTFSVSDQEAFLFRDGDRYYFSEWFEDPDYREETVMRDTDGTEARMRGTVLRMENGVLWHLF